MEKISIVSLLDTNILVYAINEDSPFHSISKAMVDQALNGDFPAAISLQNLTEFYAIATDRKRIEHPLTPQAANEIMQLYQTNPHIQLIYPLLSTAAVMNHLIDKFRPKGQSIFDYLLVATMLDNRIYQIVTSNSSHFKQFDFLKVNNPYI